MIQTSAAELERLGRKAAEAIAGADAVEQVEVLAGGDPLDRPIYFFSFLDVWSQGLMVQYFPANGRTHYGPGSPRQRHNDSGNPSSDTT